MQVTHSGNNEILFPLKDMKPFEYHCTCEAIIAALQFTCMCTYLFMLTSKCDRFHIHQVLMFWNSRGY